MGEIRTIGDLEEAMLNHDWYYTYSDDHRVWRQGEASLARLRSGSAWLSDNGFKDQVNQLWERYNQRNT